MAHAASNIIDLGAYREQRARKQMRAPAGYVMCWFMFMPVPFMVPQKSIAVGA